MGQLYYHYFPVRAASQMGRFTSNHGETMGIWRDFMGPFGKITIFNE